VGESSTLTQQSASAKPKPKLDEESFQKLLQAAYVLQEHNAELRVSTRSNGDLSRGFFEIIGIQRAIESGGLDETSALQLIAARALKLTGASGVALGMLEGREIIYRATSGTALCDKGLRLPVDSSLGSECISNGQLLQFPGADKRPQDFVQLCHQYGVAELIAAPILRQSTVVGVLELRADRQGTFQETHLHIAELMAGLVAEAIACNRGNARDDVTADEKTAMLEAIEAIRPELERLVRDQSVPTEAATEKAISKSPVIPVAKMASTSQAAVFCRCGNQFEGNEKFCGKCGTARFAESRREMQSKWASLWYLQQAKTTESSKPDEDQSCKEMGLATEAPASLEEIVTRFTNPQASAPEPGRSGEPQQNAEFEASMPDTDAQAELEAGSKANTEGTITPELEPVSETAAPQKLDSDLGPGTAIVPVSIVPTEITSQTMAIEPLPRALAHRAWELWAKVKQPDRGSIVVFWNRHRANIWIAIAIVLLMAAMFMNNRLDPQAANASANRRHPVAPSLTLFERLLVSLGIAEPPPPPAYYGNPAAKVWIDVHTALYYCPGADLYGKTDGGRVTTQKDAQQDQFEPADRRACD
jgi:GAF domain-containing protein